MNKIVFTPESFNDLKDIKSYIIKEFCSENIANNIVEKILKKIRLLETFPEIGTPISSVINLDVPYRILICDNYSTFYKIENNIIYIIRILNNRRNYMQILFGI